MGEGEGVDVEVGVNVGVIDGVIVGVAVGTLRLRCIFLSAVPPLMLFKVNFSVITPCGMSFKSHENILLG